MRLLVIGCMLIVSAVAQGAALTPNKQLEAGCLSGDDASVLAALKEGVSPDLYVEISGETALQTVCRSGNLTLATMLLKYGASVNKGSRGNRCQHSNTTPLMGTHNNEK